MPMNANGSPACINHPQQQMLRNDGFSAVTGLQVNGPGNLNFTPGTGVPAVLFYCNTCGYIELYAAQKTPFWPG